MVAHPRSFYYSSIIKEIFPRCKLHKEVLYRINALKGFNLFVFGKDGYQYFLGVDNRMGDRITIKILGSIANSKKAVRKMVLFRNETTQKPLMQLESNKDLEIAE